MLTDRCVDHRIKDKLDFPVCLRNRASPLRSWVRGFVGTLLACISGWSFAAPVAELGTSCPAGQGGVAYLSQHVQADANGVCDARQVQDVIFQLGQTGTLIVDMTCKLSTGLRLPARFSLRGLGIGVGGILAFTHDGIALSGCPESPHGYISIADLELYGPSPAGAGVNAPHATGIALSNQHIVYITNVRVSDFETGISGRNSFSVFIDGSNISSNRGDNIRIGYNANGWRIRDGIVSQAGDWGINILGPSDDTPLKVVENGKTVTIRSSNDLLIDGVRMESNKRGAVRTNAYGTRVTNTRMEGNGMANPALPRVALLVDTRGEDARILTNLLSGNCIEDRGTSTQRAFNIPASFDTEECQPLPIAPK